MLNTGKPADNRNKIYTNLPWVNINSSDWWQKEKEHLLNCNTNGNSGLLYNSNLKSFEGYL